MIWALHGAFGDAEDWDNLAESLGPDRFVAVDLWSEEHNLPLHDWAREFNRHVAEVDQAPVLLGYSMGARLGLHALISNPRLWTGAILVSPHPGLSDRNARLARRELDRQWIRRFDELQWSDFWREWTRQPVLTTNDQRPLPPVRQARRRSVDLWSLSRQDDLRKQLTDIECPVLWVTGERDEKFTAIGATTAPLIPMGRQVIVPGAGHRVPWDAPGEFVELIENSGMGNA